MNVNGISNSAAQLPILKQSQKRSAETSVEQQLTNTSSTEAKGNAAQVLLKEKEHPAALAKSEKEYFEQLFPNSTEKAKGYARTSITPRAWRHEWSQSCKQNVERSEHVIWRDVEPNHA